MSEAGTAIALVQARLSSKRLPGKILMDIAGKPMLQHVIERASRIPGVDKAAIITAWQDRETLQQALPAFQILAYPIPEDDCLTRYAWAALDLDASWVLRVTGDCPCVDPAVCGRVLQAAIQHGRYVSNDVALSGYPDGLDCQCWPVAALLRESVQATDLQDREHPGRWAERQPSRLVVMAEGVWTHDKLSIDTRADLARVRQRYAHTHNEHVCAVAVPAPSR